MAALLASAWRTVPLRLEISAEQLDEVTPLLLESGVAALVWRRLRQSNVQASESASQLEQAYRLHTLRAAVHERAIRRILTRLRDAARMEALVLECRRASLLDHRGRPIVASECSPLQSTLR